MKLRRPRLATRRLVIRTATARDAAALVAFRELRLHRVVADHLPSNRRSVAVLKRLGFRREGLARDDLLIGGRRRDDAPASLVDPTWRPVPDDSVAASSGRRAPGRNARNPRRRGRIPR